MKTIWKYPLDPSTSILLRVPKGAKILTVQLQGNFPHIWFLVDTNNKLETRKFFAYITDEELPTYPGKYAGTFQSPATTLIFHIFETT